MFKRKSKLPKKPVSVVRKLSLETSATKSSPLQRQGRNDTSPSTATASSSSTTTSNGSLKTHIEVCARIRPLEIQVELDGYFDSSSNRKRFLPGSGKKSKRAPGTISGDGDSCAWDVSADENTAAQSNRTDIIEGRTHSYTIDKVYGTQSTTRQLYDNSIHSLVKSAMEGYHSSILAYGQTSTGKTYTMSGTKDSPGLIPLCIGDCFRYVRESQEPRDYMIRVSYLEVSRVV
jgi:hypothetical protein